MKRAAIDVWTARLEAAYRADPFHALRKNIESVRPDEWEVRPASWSVEEFGTQPELSVCDLVFHVGGAKYMYADRAFGEMKLEWTDIALPASRDMQEVLAWLDGGHRLLVEGMAALTDDAQLTEARLAPWRLPLTREQLLGIIINHDLYHSGEINRQRALLRGAEGWARGG
jgi:uncharacterized damage-inducible protein DinB